MHTMYQSHIIKAGLLVVSLFLGLSTGIAQSTDNHLTVLGDAFEEVAADQGTLSVNLTYSDEKDITLVYEQHKAGRERLAALLNELKVPTKDIQILQLMVRKERDFSMGGGGMGQPVEKFKGFQRVAIKFDDLKRYALVQQRLASDGFMDLFSSFSVSNQRDIELRLSDVAVTRAKEKAERMAKAASRTIKRIVRMGDIEETEAIGYIRTNQNNIYMNAYNMEVNRPVATISQTFRITASVKVVFEMN
ncbi:SIMPL domain-containing protein [Spirosoma sp.]|uniref:SIMPL domain-containing protein n=1 Tax=Spirosoma sp. TaxID=1899569 RepID=UPI0026133AA8|nr:SIMPL domain-containing protein [Spirosoma sp.]MCX6215979.1 SIMPL domain-containing protein [Spirosoma sp.]